MRWGFASQLEADSPPSPLFSRISSLRIVFRGSDESCAVISHSVPIQIAVSLSTQRAALPGISPRIRWRLPNFAILPACQSSCSWVQVYLIDKNTTRHQYLRLRLPVSRQRRPLTCQPYCTVSEHPPALFPSQRRAQAAMLAGLWAS